MTQLAERIHGGTLIALAAVAGVGAFLAPGRSAAPHVVVVEPQPPPQQVRVVHESGCPEVVKARFDATYELTCTAGNFPAAGYFVRAKYHTTEAWERIGVVTVDGSKDLAAFADRPCRFGDAPVRYRSVDLDGDGAMELVAITSLEGMGAVDVLAVHADGVVTVPGPAIRAASVDVGAETLDVIESATNEVVRYALRDGVLAR